MFILLYNALLCRNLGNDRVVPLYLVRKSWKELSLLAQGISEWRKLVSKFVLQGAEAKGRDTRDVDRSPIAQSMDADGGGGGNDDDDDDDDG